MPATYTVGGQPASNGWSDVTTTYTAYLDTPLVNGQAYPTLTVDPKSYRFRMLNAGNDRFLNLGLYLAADKQTTNPNTPNDPKSQPELCDGRLVRKDNTPLNVSDCTEVKMVAMDGSYPGLYYTAAELLANQPASPDGVLAFPTSGGLMGTGWGDPSGQLAEGVPDPATIGPNFYLIGNDAGYLANMVDIPSTPVNFETNKRSITVMNVLEHGLYLGAGNRADVVVGEINYGGDMVRFTVQTARRRTPYKAVHATRGKAVRAEPISALYEQGKVRHVGYFRELEDRRKTILASIEDQGKLTPELKARIEATLDKSELEYLYLPYRPKRRTKATIAREKGLEPIEIGRAHV